MIKFDLHIHSIASKYKEEAGIVENSTIDNIEVLLSQLNKYQVALFSITDHNRFDAEIYKKVNAILHSTDSPYVSVKTLLPGVEFDVVFDSAMDKCHIIAIFDFKNDESNFNIIANAISKNLLDKNGAYSKDEFERILCDIKLDTILIACQRSSIERHDGKHNSLSDSTMEVEQILRLGYINALEFQKPKVEGILINNLKDLPTSVGLVSGSDCHQWSSYPYHDEKNPNKDFQHSKANILPTFKGLLMAVTSPETRFNCRENSNPVFFDEVKIDDQKIHLANGINAIIGENGSGKSTLIKFLNNDIKEKHVQNIVRNSLISLPQKVDLTRVKYIQQGEIISKFNNNKQVFSTTDDNYKAIDNSVFSEAYTGFAQSLLDLIKVKIKQKAALDSLVNLEILYNSVLERKVYFVNIVCPKGFDTLENKHSVPFKKVEKLINDIDAIDGQAYFREYHAVIVQARNLLYLIYKDIFLKHLKISIEEKVKNIICSCITDYTSRITANSSSQDREINEYVEKKQRLNDAVFEAIKLRSTPVPYLKAPEPINGTTSSSKRGFYFNREARYNNISMIDTFFSFMFTKDYCTMENVLNIDMNSKLVLAIRNCSSESDIEFKWKENVDKFLRDSLQVTDYITDDANRRIGNTLGEMSLSYYKYFTQDVDDWNILVIDQPEDNISNNNISKYLISYFNSLRDKRQLIFVTHNPLLVVNLDVDNVIFVQNNEDKLTITSGSLEYEDECSNILEIVAKNMDGGKESIEKRLKVYGKNN